MARNRYRPAFSRYDEAVVLNDAHNTINAFRSAAAGPSTTHPLCFTDKTVAHSFPTNFKPTKCDKYEGTTDLALWISDYILVVQVANDDDYHPVKYMPLMLKGSARAWLRILPPRSIQSWEDLQVEFMANFRGTYIRPADASDLVSIAAFKHGSKDEFLSRYFGHFKLKTMPELIRVHGDDDQILLW